MSYSREYRVGEYYSVSNIGAQGVTLFREKEDYARFLFSLLYFQSPLVFKNIPRYVHSFSDIGFRVDDESIETVLSERTVELVAFVLLPKRFSILLRELSRGGISAYMQRVLNGYTKYTQHKYYRSGHVFEGRYRSKSFASDAEILRFSGYLHLSPREIPSVKGSEDIYPWSSFQDFIGANRWGGLIVPEVIASNFARTPKSNYESYVKTLSFKDLGEEFSL